jgi:two-component system sensor histidine kinase KdpD
LISVIDRGPGIPEDELEAVFNKFHRLQTSRKTSGIGLGLTICRAMVEAHGGRIWAENITGGGTRVSITLPLDQEVPGKVSCSEGGGLNG